jgi:CRISPR-associated endonuclease Csn1
MVDRIVVSHKPDHKTPGTGGSGSTSARLHEETYYGLAKDQSELPDDKMRLVVRVHLKDLREKDIADISDARIRREMAYAVDSRADGEKPEAAIMRYGRERNIRRVRTYVEKSQKAMRSFKDKNGKPYRYAATGGNHHIDIFCPIKDNKDLKTKAGKWYAETVTHFDANQKGFEPQWRKDHPTAKLIMRLHINDMIAYDDNGVREIRRVKKISGSNDLVYLVPHLVAAEQGDKLSWAASANLLQQKNARKITVTPAGKVLDAGKAPMPKPFRKPDVA